MRWPNSLSPGVQPYDDAVLAEYEGILEQIVALADREGMTALEMIEEWRAVNFGDYDDDMPQPAWQEWHDDLDEILKPHVTPELDDEDITYELIELIGTPDDDNFNE